MRTATLTPPKKVAVPPMIPSMRVGTDWTIAGPLIAAHAMALFAPFFFSWAGLAMLFVLYLVSGLGVTAGAHRLFTHSAFKATPVFKYLLALMFLLSAQGSLLRWVRDHHIHHSFSDQEGDPHSPHLGHGFWYAHLTWLWKSPPTRLENKQLYARFGGNLNRDRFLQATSKGLGLLGFHFAVMAMVYVIGALFEAGFHLGALTDGWFTGISCLIWGVFLRIVLVLHATSLVNSATHLWGYRSYPTQEGSRNNWWVALVSLGEGWHNNHHSRPGTANQGFHRWWEFDLTFCFLVIAAWFGLARDLRVYRARAGKTEIWFAQKSVH